MGGWQVLGAVGIAAFGAYYVGHQHGSDRAALDLKRASAPVEVAVAYPLASTCSTMLEAAWAVEEVSSTGD